VVFFGIIVALAGMIPANIAPNPKVGGSIIAVLFIFLEAFSLIGSIPDMTWPEIIIRIYTAIAVVAGCVVAATNNPEFKLKPSP
jgi:hypothetical protein